MGWTSYTARLWGLIMQDQPTLFDYAATDRKQAIDTPEQAKRAAIRRVEENANQEFLDCAYRVLCDVARVRAEFSAKDVWDVYESDPTRPITHQPRAIGSVFVRASKAGIIRPTDRYVKSGRSSDHNQNLRVWASLVCGA